MLIGSGQKAGWVQVVPWSKQADGDHKTRAGRGPSVAHDVLANVDAVESRLRRPMVGLIRSLAFTVLRPPKPAVQARPRSSVTGPNPKTVLVPPKRMESQTLPCRAPPQFSCAILAAPRPCRASTSASRLVCIPSGKGQYNVCRPKATPRSSPTQAMQLPSRSPLWRRSSVSAWMG